MANAASSKVGAKKIVVIVILLVILAIAGLCIGDPALFNAATASQATSPPSTAAPSAPITSPATLPPSTAVPSVAAVGTAGGATAAPAPAAVAAAAAAAAAAVSSTPVATSVLPWIVANGLAVFNLYTGVDFPGNDLGSFPFSGTCPYKNLTALGAAFPGAAGFVINSSSGTPTLYVKSAFQNLSTNAKCQVYANQPITSVTNQQGTSRWTLLDAFPGC